MKINEALERTVHSRCQNEARSEIEAMLKPLRALSHNRGQQSYRLYAVLDDIETAFVPLLAEQKMAAIQGEIINAVEQFMRERTK